MSKEKDPMERIAVALEEFVGIQKEALEKRKLKEESSSFAMKDEMIRNDVKNLFS